MPMKRKITKKNIIIGTVTALLVVSISLFIFFLNPQRTFNITETYRITTADGADTFLRVTLPVSDGYQKVTSVQIDGATEYAVERFDGWHELTAQVPANGKKAVVTISYTVSLLRNIAAWEGDVKSEYTLPQQFVDSDNEAIAELAAQLRGTNDFQTARNIFNYANKIIKTRTGTFATQGKEQTQSCASELLLNPVGVCYDYAILMTALLRAEGIPARMISGLSLQVPLSRGGDWSHPGVSHSWVEFYADGKWHFADPTWGKGYFNRTDTAHLSFGTLEANIKSDFQQNRLAAIEEDGFVLIGAMSAPLSFVVYSSDENTTVIPRADVSFSWFK